MVLAPFGLDTCAHVFQDFSNSRAQQVMYAENEIMLSREIKGRVLDWVNVAIVL